MKTIADIVTLSDEVRKDIEHGINILKNGGCEAIYVFRSVADGRNTSRSDIDFAVKGCPAHVFYKLQGKLLVELTRSADLIDLDADPDLTSFLEREAALTYVG